MGKCTFVCLCVFSTWCVVLCLLYFSCLCSAHAPATKDQCVLANPLWSMFVELTGLCLVLFGQPPLHCPVALCQIIFPLLATFHRAVVFPIIWLDTFVRVFFVWLVIFLTAWTRMTHTRPLHIMSFLSFFLSLFPLFFVHNLSSSDDYFFIERWIYFAIELIPSYFACNWEHQNVLLISVADSLVAYRLKY